jgi:hypothetical protein
LAEGEEYILEVENGVGLRICAVAGGRAKVTLGLLNFSIGVGGMWRVKAGQKCGVKNMGKDMAVVHVTSIP